MRLLPAPTLWTGLRRKGPSLISLPDMPDESSDTSQRAKDRAHQQPHLGAVSAYRPRPLSRLFSRELHTSSALVTGALSDPTCQTCDSVAPSRACVLNHGGQELLDDGSEDSSSAPATLAVGRDAHEGQISNAFPLVTRTALGAYRRRAPHRLHAKPAPLLIECNASAP